MEILNHYEKYPQLEIQDIFKFLYQSAFGCEHMVSSLEKAIEYVQEEYAGGVTESEIEFLDGGCCRVPLSYIDKGLKAESLAKLFFLSAKKEENGRKNLIKNLETVQKLILEKKLPFDKETFEKAVREWEEKGFPPVHHSEKFRSLYKPAYRLISKKFIPFLQLIIEIDNRLNSGSLKLAIEGKSASGKSTLARILKDIYVCTVLHMDDFFLQPHQRTSERLNEAGGNIDKERFLEEVLLPLSENKKINYRPFDCAEMTVKEGMVIEPEKFIIIEGVYSMHPEFEKYYDFSVFLDIEKEKQRERILKRNGEKLGKRFFSEWIPMEEKYFSAFGIKEKCSMKISIE